MSQKIWFELSTGSDYNEIMAESQQSPNQNEQTVALEELAALQQQVGKLLAMGMTSFEILEALREGGLTENEASYVLQSVYQSWSSAKMALQLQPEDKRNWHEFMRMQLLQRTLQVEGASMGNLALRILDSLAGIQGISTIPTDAIPLSIMFVDTESTAAPNPAQEQENENGTR